jgi:hypothetical protein
MTPSGRNDIDLLFITIDYKKAESSSLALNTRGVNVHSLLMPGRKRAAIPSLPGPAALHPR